MFQVKHLYLKIFFSMILVTLLSLLIVGLGISLFYHSLAQEKMEAELAEKSQEVLEIVKPALARNDYPALAQSSRLVRRFIRGSLFISDREGHLLPLDPPFFKKVMLIPGEERQLLVRLKKIPSGKHQTLRFQKIPPFDRNGERFCAVMTPVYQQNDFLGGIIVVSPMLNLRATLTVLKNSMLLIGIIAIILAAVISYLLAARIVKPLKTMSQTALGYARGDFSQRVPVTTGDELGQLASIFNFVAGEMESFLRSQKEFVANVSHELRTPLSLIQGYLEALQDGYAETPDQTTQFLAISHQETLRLKRLVDNLLTLSKVESSLPEKEPLDLNNVVRYALTALRPDAEKKEIQLDFNACACGVEPIILLGDRDQLTQVIINLAGNAIQYSPPHTTVTIRTVLDEKHKQVLLTISDQGPGIPEQLQKQIWDRFYRVEKSRSRAAGGFGLGLAIVKSIVTRMKGTVELQSIEGKGCTFTVKFQL